MSETETTATTPPPGPSARLRVGVGAAVVLVVVALVCSVLVTALSPVGATTLLTPATAAPDARGRPVSPGPSASPSPSSRSSPPAVPGPPGDTGASPGATDPAGAAVLVHVLGAVRQPGIYRLAEGARVFDALGLAGGFAESADQASVNLARPLTDGEQLRVLAVGEAPPAGASSGTAAFGPAPGSAAGAGAAAGAASAVGAKVNLNAATALDLDALPRIGPAMAARIVGWRESNGPFSSVDDLLQVTGIGDKTLEGLRDLVSV